MTNHLPIVWNHSFGPARHLCGGLGLKASFNCVIVRSSALSVRRIWSILLMECSAVV